MIPEPLLSDPFIPAGDSSAALAHLGLDAEVLTDAVLTGVRRAQDINAFYPVTARGFTQWSETVAFLRESLLKRDWTKEDPQNSPRVTSPDSKFSIMVVGGNASTGMSLQAKPGTARRRGPATTAAVEINVQQMLDLPGLPIATVGRAPSTWVLLYHCSYSESVVRAELSLPDAINDGDISNWHSRILLPPVELADVDISLNPLGPQDDVDFRITQTS